MINMKKKGWVTIAALLIILAFAFGRSQGVNEGLLVAQGVATNCSKILGDINKRMVEIIGEASDD